MAIEDHLYSSVFPSNIFDLDREDWDWLMNLRRLFRTSIPEIDALYLCFDGLLWSDLCLKIFEEKYPPNCLKVFHPLINTVKCRRSILYNL